MNNSTKKVLEQIINQDNCPFTEDEVHGFFCGLTLSGSSQDDIINQSKAFLDLRSDREDILIKLIANINDEVSNNSFSLMSKYDNNLEQILNKFSEWTYYFLIGLQSKNSDFINNPSVLEILDIFDEISQLNEKYKPDDDNNKSIESLVDINNFIAKSLLYLFNSKNDTTALSKNKA